ncbi:hypothetical protein IFT77_05425 [Frigoribacterium sp. CFBP 13729]|uniref:hypothetical protein n=1 Tax=Frigoribacterium sp. CFBP 13729 TaxID=2775293 RepID=UPI0017803944|nr:hypothetical protein [Frigoribacterium sp. CFBP 13729]MBD8609919.1 hypothetical protein [Frigoribacterium sp. CFBP 13729]
MKKRHSIGTTVLAVALFTGAGTAAQAQAATGAPADYCAPSVGCAVDPVTGDRIFVNTPNLTQKEKTLMLECNHGMGGALLTAAGGVFKKNWGSVLKGAGKAAETATGPCKDLWDSTTRLR